MASRKCPRTSLAPAAVLCAAGAWRRGAGRENAGRKRGRSPRGRHGEGAQGEETQAAKEAVLRAAGHGEGAQGEETQAAKEAVLCAAGAWRRGARTRLSSGPVPSGLLFSRPVRFFLGATAQFGGASGSVFSVLCGMQIPRFPSSIPSKSAFAADEKSIRRPTASFVRCCP